MSQPTRRSSLSLRTYSAYLGDGPDGPHSCQYGSASVDGVPVVTGDDTDIGAVELPHLAQQDRLACLPSSP